MNFKTSFILLQHSSLRPCHFAGTNPLGCSSQNREFGEGPLGKYYFVGLMVTPTEGLLFPDLGIFAVTILIIPVGADEGARVSVWRAGGIIRGCYEALGYPHRDHISVALWWPAASLLRGVNTVNCTKLRMQPAAVSEESPETLEWVAN